jgi:hypothetical protein
MFPKSHTHKKCGTLRKKSFPQGSMLKFTYKGRFLTIEKAYKNFLDWKSEWWKHALVPPLHVQIFIFEKTLKSQFLVVFQSFDFGQIWAVLGKICCIDCGWEHARSKDENFKTPLLLNRESKCYMEHLIGKLLSISIASKSFQKSKNLLHSQQPIQKRKKLFGSLGPLGARIDCPLNRQA